MVKMCKAFLRMKRLSGYPFPKPSSSQVPQILTVESHLQSPPNQDSCQC